ncbi:HIT domain-containing protein [Candidatus Woesearchaeota archaeon]|nr:HIT domain-containing protein [Candidatus Woesearchaeota archaeon]
MDFSQFLLKTYLHWELYLHKNQFPYIGRCYAWARRAEADKISDMTVAEMEELFISVIPHWEHAVQQLYQPSRTNLAILGNETPHLHAHLIPRYIVQKNFYGIAFQDPNPYGNYAPYPKKELSLEVLLKIKQEIQQKLKE